MPTVRIKRPENRVSLKFGDVIYVIREDGSERYYIATLAQGTGKVSTGTGKLSFTNLETGDTRAVANPVDMTPTEEQLLAVFKASEIKVIDADDAVIEISTL